MTDPLFSLAYFSRNAIEGSSTEVQRQIAQILTSARRNNASRSFTGALLFSDGCFAQVLEAQRGDVEGVFEAIQCDPRHKRRDHPAPARGRAAQLRRLVDGLRQHRRRLIDDMCPADGILATVAGQNLLLALRNVVHRDDLSRRDEIAAP